MLRRDWAASARAAEREATIAAAIASVPLPHPGENTGDASFLLGAEVYRVEDARAAADGGATEITFDAFLRHPAPPAARVRALAEELSDRGVSLRLRTPSIIDPAKVGAAA